MIRARLVLATVPAGLALVAIVGLSSGARSADSEAVHVGAASCAGSSCHGSTQDWQRLAGSGVAQTEYRTWQRRDAHARAYDSLHGIEGRRIAENLGIDDARTAEECLICHTDQVPKAQRGPQWTAKDGVTCEACHGAAIDWLRSHPRGAKHDKNVEAGLVPLDQPRVRAGVCVDCHVGDADRFVSHRLYGAGHPRMSFELDTFSVTQPAHWIMDEDWSRRGKVVSTHVERWAIGQAVAADRQLELLAARFGAGAFPELAFYDCQTCHHPFSEARWRPRADIGVDPGVPRLDDAHLVMLRVLATRVDPGLAQKIAAETSKLRHAAAHDREAWKAPAEALRALAGQVADAVEAKPLEEADVRAIAGELAALGEAGHLDDYTVAEQATMAMGALVGSSLEAGWTPEARRAAIEGAMERCYLATADADAYEPAPFRAALSEVRDAL